ncbi:MAG: hypothetical protein EA356_15040 [Geminicoccaceae bacterium]|nr:MAG: hypothetical protein EA356_15040 [Geminicoccaceae bacterium]
MTRALVIGAAAGALLTACAVETVRDVAALKRLVDARDPDAIVAYEVDCPPAAPGCAQAHTIRADACLRRAQGVGVVDREAYARCAAESYDAAQVAAAARPDPLVDPARLVRWELEALRFWRDAAARDRGLALNATLAERAERVATAATDRPEGPYYLADARIWPVNLGIEQPPCPGVASALALAEAALPLEQAGEVDVQQLVTDLARAALAHGCDVPT